MPVEIKIDDVEGAYWFGPVCVCLGHTLERSRTVRDRILKFDIWNKYEK